MDGWKRRMMIQIRYAYQKWMTGVLRRKKSNLEASKENLIATESSAQGYGRYKALGPAKGRAHSVRVQRHGTRMEEEDLMGTVSNPSKRM